MEYRIVLTDEEAFDLSSRLTFISVGYVRDEYTGEIRKRTDLTGKILDKEYKTPVKGVVYRFSAKCKLGDIENIWFEEKWTDNCRRFEIEFEGEIPEEVLYKLLFKLST